MMHQITDTAWTKTYDVLKSNIEDSMEPMQELEPKHMMYWNSVWI